MFPVKIPNYTYEDSCELFRSLKSSSDKELFELFNFHTCYPTLTDNPFMEEEPLICQCTVGGFDYTFTRHLEDSRYNEFLFEIQGSVYSAQHLFHFLFQELPDSTQKDFIEKHYDETQSNTSLVARFNRHLDKVCESTLNNLANIFLQPYNFNLASSKKGITQLSFQVKSQAETFYLQLTRFSPYRVHFKFVANVDTVLKNNAYTHLFAPIKKDIEQKYPDISLSSFCTVDKSECHLFNFLLNSYKTSNEYKLHSMFNDVSI